MFIKKLIPVACLTAVLGFGLPSTPSTASTASTASTGQVTEAVKQAGHATSEAGKQVVKTTEKAAKKVGSGVKEGATTVGSETKHVFTGTPKRTTGLCRDGTYTKATTRSSACSKHGGVRQWF